MVSIIVPVYNEERTIYKVIKGLKSLSIQKEIIVVNDGSTDSTASILDSYKGIKVIHMDENKGKASAIKKGLQYASGKYVVFQDADLEYPVENIYVLYKSIESTQADMVVGVRTISWDKLTDISLGSFIANKFIRKLTGGYDIFSGQRIIKTSVLNEICIESSGFEIETEIFLKLVAHKYRINWVPVRYIPRTRAEGKKIGLKDFLAILYTYYRLRYNNFSQKPITSHS